MNAFLANPFQLSLKAIFACWLALLLDAAWGNPDHVSSTFVAVLCLSPTVILGLRQAFSQSLGSLLGGIWGTLAALTGWPMLLTLPVATGLAIGSSYLARIPTGYPISAFTALFLLLVPWGSPLATFKVRFLALFIASLSGFVVNVVFSALNYRNIFGSRLEKTETYILSLLPKLLTGRKEWAQSGFNLLGAMQGELGAALEEMAWRKNHALYHRLRHIWRRAEHLRYVLHLTYELASLFQEKQVTSDTVVHFAAWLKQPQGEPPVLPPDFDSLRHRLGQAMAALHAQDYAVY